MAYFPTTNIQFANSLSVDAFSRLRVSQPTTLFDSATRYDSGTALWEYSTSAGGTTAFNHDWAAIVLGVDTALGSKAIRQTRQYWPYQPGKSQLVVITGVFGTPVAGCVKRWGYFDDEDGLFFEQNGTGLAVVQRTSTGGSSAVRDTKVYQSDWNVDTFSGTGASLFNLDTTKANIYIIDLEWLGVGRVRFGCYSPQGQPIGAHVFENANSKPHVYMSTATLPLRMEISNTATIASPTSIETICFTVVTEGGFEESRTYSRCTFSSTATAGHAVAQGIAKNLIAIRPLTSFNGQVNRAWAYPVGVELMVQTNPVYWELVWNPAATGLNTAFLPVDPAASMMEVSTGGAVNNFGGVVINSGYVWAGGGGANAVGTSEVGPVLSRAPISLNIAGTSGACLALRATGIGGGATVHAALKWREAW